MKTPSNQLFTLIKSLSKTEKSYFKKYVVPKSSKHSEKYIAVFDAITKMEPYDEAWLKKEFNIRSFSELKQYLSKKIRQALRNYHAEKNVEIKLNNYLTDIHIFYHKGLFQHCSDLIYKAEKMARRCEYYEVLLRLNVYKAKVRKGKEDYASTQEKVVLDMQEFQQYISKLKNTLQYRIYNDLLFVEKSQRVGTIGIKEIESMHSPPGDAPSTLFGKLYDQETKFNLAGMRNDMSAYLEARKNILQLFEENAPFRKENPELYIIALFDWINVCAVAEQPEVGLSYMPKALNAVETLKLERHFKLTRQAVYGSFEFQLNFELGNYRKAEEIFPKYLTWLQHYADQCKARHVLIFYYRLLTGAIYFERYDDALHIGSIILDNSRFHIRLDIQVFTRFMLILVHFELGNVLFLESFLQSTYQFVRNHDFETAFSSLFIQFFKRHLVVQKIRHTKVRHQLLENLKKEILALFQEKPSTEVVNKYFQFIRWIDSRLKGKRMEELAP